MSVHNNEHTIVEAVDSILHQTYGEFEFIIINDASTDQTASILASYTDPRIHLLHNEQNLGLTRSLNRGLEIAQGNYVARMDADDVSLPQRLAEQIDYLTRYPDISAVGANTISIDEKGIPLYNSKPHYPDGAEPQTIHWELLFSNPLPHMTMMAHREILHYDSAFEVAQDYDLWARLSAQYKLVRLPQVLVKRRIEKQSITSLRREKQLAAHYAIVQRGFNTLLGDFSVDTLKMLFNIMTEQPAQPINTRAVIRLFLQAYQQFTQRNLTPLEKKQIQTSAIHAFIKIYRYTQQLYPLSQLWRISPQFFFSKHMAYLLKESFSSR